MFDIAKNQLYINFDQYIDVNELISIRPLISCFIAKNSHLVKPSSYSHGSLGHNKNLFGIYDLQSRFLKNPDVVADPILREKIKSLIDSDRFGHYAQFEEDITSGTFSLVPRYSKSYSTKHLAAESVSLPEDQQLDFFYDWLRRQNIFDEYGRVTFFINFQGGATPCHRDYPDTYLGNSDQFIWLNLFPSHKRLYLLEKQTGEKIYLDGVSCWFNTGNWHGSDVALRPCYSLRVDGVFTDDFLQRISSQ